MTHIVDGYIVSLLFLLFCKTKATQVTDKWIAYGSSCYFISIAEELTAPLASIECLKIGAHLVEVTSPEENDIITHNLVNDQQYWVGMEKNDTGDFVWILDRSGPLVPWTSWDVTSSPDASMVRYRRETGKWKLNRRTEPIAFRYICEKHKSYISHINCINDVDNHQYITLAENKTSASSTNSSRFDLYGPPKAIDGSLSTCAVSDVEDNPWWQIDLKEQTLIRDIEILSRNCCGNANVLQKFEVLVYVTEPNQTVDSTISHVCGWISLNVAYKSSAVLICPSNTIGKYIRITRKALSSHLALCNIKIKGRVCTNDVIEKTCSEEISYNIYDFNVTEHKTPINQTSCQFDVIMSTAAFTQSNTLSTSTTASFSILSSSTQIYHSSVSDQDDFEELVKEMRLDKKSTNTYRRSLISAEDKRVSSMVSGYIGIFVLITVLCVLLFFDALRFYQFLATRREID